jgi:tetratricopeptide (TPR) repeat protein
LARGTVRCVRWRLSELDERVEEIMGRLRAAGGDHTKRAVALEDYLRLAYAHEDDQFDIGPWSEDLADSYLVVGRVDDAIRVTRDATRSGHSDGAEMLCDLAGKLTRGGREPQARRLWDEARAAFPDDVWVYVQAGIDYGDIGDHATALGWLTPGMELALRTGDPQSALAQLCPLRSSCLSALGHEPDDLQARARAAQARENT